MNKKRIFLGFVLMGMLLNPMMSSKAQSESEVSESFIDKISVKLYGDAVSSYVWRGFRQTGFSIQPSLTAHLGGFSLGAWGSTDFNASKDSGFKEVDFFASYTVDNFTIAATDYWWDGEGAFHYFSTPEDGYSGHMLEGSLSYTFPEKFPLTASWNTFFLGEGNKKADGDNSFSTYVELSYPFSVKEVDLHLAVGFTPWASVVYGTDGFDFTQIRLGASKEIKITDSFGIPISGNIIANPFTEDIYFVFGLRIQ